MHTPTPLPIPQHLLRFLPPFPTPPALCHHRHHRPAAAPPPPQARPPARPPTRHALPRVAVTPPCGCADRGRQRLLLTADRLSDVQPVPLHLRVTVAVRHRPQAAAGPAAAAAAAALAQAAVRAAVQLVLPPAPGGCVPRGTRGARAAAPARSTPPAGAGVRHGCTGCVGLAVSIYSRRPGDYVSLAMSGVGRWPWLGQPPHATCRTCACTQPATEGVYSGFVDRVPMSTRRRRCYAVRPSVREDGTPAFQGSGPTTSGRFVNASYPRVFKAIVLKALAWQPALRCFRAERHHQPRLPRPRNSEPGPHLGHPQHLPLKFRHVNARAGPQWGVDVVLRARQHMSQNNVPGWHMPYTPYTVHCTRNRHPSAPQSAMVMCSRTRQAGNLVGRVPILASTQRVNPRHPPHLR